MGGSLAKVGATVAAAMVASHSAANAADCGASMAGSRFVEAARLCGDGQPRARPAAVPTSTAVQVQEREAVSVAMPGFSHRVASARRELERQGGARATPALVAAIADRYRINRGLLASMMHAESAGRPGAVSNKGALGLMQVMPGTARSMGVRDPGAMLGNPVLAMSTGAAYLKRLQARYGNNVPVVVAAYNAGPGAVDRARGIPRYTETRGYVRNVMGGYTARMR